MSAVWPWLAVAGLGAYHGLDPSMGWLFAVALGLQERSLARVVCALGPLTLGHLLSIAAVVAFVVGLSAVIAINYIRPVGAAILVLFGIFRYIWPRAHPRWVAMRVNSAELTLWSFLMSSAHGAGLMLFPACAPHLSRHVCKSDAEVRASDRAGGDDRAAPHRCDDHNNGSRLNLRVPVRWTRDPAQRVDQSRYDLGGRAGRGRLFRLRSEASGGSFYVRRCRHM